jgi:hypothetical protein
MCPSAGLLEQMENFEEDWKQDLEEIQDKVEEGKSLVSKVNFEDPSSIFKGIAEKLAKHPVCISSRSSSNIVSIFNNLSTTS